LEEKDKKIISLKKQIEREKRQLKTKLSKSDKKWKHIGYKPVLS
jgi:hypothetical protein